MTAPGLEASQWLKKESRKNICSLIIGRRKQHATARYKAGKKATGGKVSQEDDDNSDPELSEQWPQGEEEVTLVEREKRGLRKSRA